MKIWDLRTAGLYETLKFDHGVTALQFDSRKVVSAAGENGVKVYQMHIDLRYTIRAHSIFLLGL